MSYFEEIFGLESLPKPSEVRPKLVPEIQLDDWRWQFSPPSAASLNACSKIERDALSAELLGEHSPEKTFLGDPDALARYRKLAPAPAATPTFNAPSLAKFASKVESLRKRAPEHKQDVADILAKFRRKLGGPDNQEAWDRLQQSCENFVSQAIMEV